MPGSRGKKWTWTRSSWTRGSSQHHGRDVMHQGGVVSHAELSRAGVMRRGGVRVVEDHPRGSCGSCGRGGVLLGGPVPGALLVRPETRQLRVGRLADVALVRPLAGVEPHVVPQRGRLAEAPVAEATHEGFVQRVDAHVRAQVAARVEPTATDDAAHTAQAG